MLLDWGLGPEQVCLELAGSVWVLDFMQEKSHKSPCDSESMFIKAENSETKEDLKVEEETGECRRGCFGFLEAGEERSEPSRAE